MTYPSKELVKNISPVPRTLSQANRDAEYCSAIIYPKESEYSVFWGLLGALVAVAVFGYCFWLTINRF